MRRRFCIPTGLRARTASVLGLSIAAVFAAGAQEKVTFADHVLPLVEQHCAKCHNPDKKKGDLDLSSHGV